MKNKNKYNTNLNVYMSTDIREVKASIDENIEKIKNLIIENKLDEAEKLTADTEKLKKIYDGLVELEEDELDNIKNKINNSKATKIKNIEEKAKYDGNLFCKVIANTLLKQKEKNEFSATREQFEFTDSERMAISENIDEDGGYAVPEDISVKINKRLKDSIDLSTLVDSEQVYTRSGQRTYEKRMKQTPLGKLSEYNSSTQTYGKIKDTDNPKLERISFNLIDFAGMITIPNDLLKFASKELENFIIDWIVDKVRVTRNMIILNGYKDDDGDEIEGIFSDTTKFKKVDLKSTSTIKNFKKLKNVTLNSVFKKSSKWIVNQDGFNYLDSLEDKNGRSYLQPDPKNETEYKFLGLPVIEINNETLETETIKSGSEGSETITSISPIILGDLKEAYKIFHDGKYQLATTNIGAGAFETNTNKARVINKLDGSVKDDEAIIIAKLTLPEENA